MQYMGGKFRQSKWIVSKLVEKYNGERIYLEPFCGALGVAEKAIPALANLGVECFVLSDVSRPLITMWNSLINGREPPDFIDEDEYQLIKSRKDSSDPMTAWCGFALSFGGKWFGGYARHNSDSNDIDSIKRSQLNQKKAVFRKISNIADRVGELICTGYNGWKPKQCIVYLDPPYANRVRAHSHGGDFDHNKFWSWADKISINNNVIVTEFIAPESWVPVYSFGDTVVRHHSSKGSDGTNECIFEHV